MPFDSFASARGTRAEALHLRTSGT